MDDIRWFATLGVGGVLAAMAMIMSRKQADADKAAREALHAENVASLRAITERLEHIINTTRMERQATSEALLSALQQNSAVIASHTSAVASHTSVVHDLRDWMRDDVRRRNIA